MIASTASCPSSTDGWEEVTSLYSWRGTNAGCSVPATTSVSAGSCTSDSLNGDPIDVRDATVL